MKESLLLHGVHLFDIFTSTLFCVDGSVCSSGGGGIGWGWDQGAHQIIYMFNDIGVNCP